MIHAVKNLIQISDQNNSKVNTKWSFLEFFTRIYYKRYRIADYARNKYG